MTLSLEIITQEKVILKDDVDEIIVPTVTGQITILPKHISLLTNIAEGEVIIKKNNKEQSLVVTGGFLEVKGDKVTILADYAVRGEDIEITRAEAAKKRAEKLMEESTSKKDFVQAEAQLRRLLLELKVAQKRKVRPIQQGTT